MRNDQILQAINKQAEKNKAKKRYKDALKEYNRLLRNGYWRAGIEFGKLITLKDDINNN